MSGYDYVLDKNLLAMFKEIKIEQYRSASGIVALDLGEYNNARNETASKIQKLDQMSPKYPLPLYLADGNKISVADSTDLYKPFPGYICKVTAVASMDCRSIEVAGRAALELQKIFHAPTTLIFNRVPVSVRPDDTPETIVQKFDATQYPPGPAHPAGERLWNPGKYGLC